MKNRLLLRSWAARALIGIVAFWNLQCALVYFLNPGKFSSGFELTGIPGEAAVRGTAVLFMMWNVPYLAAAWHPIRNRPSLLEALVMQGIGLAGEGILLALLPSGHDLLRTSIWRFIAFDAAGLVLLVTALFIIRQEWRKIRPQDSH